MAAAPYRKTSHMEKVNPKRVIGILIVILTSFLCIGCFNGHNNKEVNNGNEDVVSYNTSDEIIENNGEEIKVDEQENIIQKDENS